MRASFLHIEPEEHLFISLDVSRSLEKGTFSKDIY